MSAGPLITFYSFKGGVGRTQAVANVAAELARRGKRVGLVDMDLESPGLHTYFAGQPYGSHYKTKELAEVMGLLDLLELGRNAPNRWLAQLDDCLLPCWHRALEGIAGSVHLLPAGRQDASYPRRLAEFSWDRFYTGHEGYDRLEELRASLLDRFDVVLLDSRTGVTDTGIVTTLQLPDVVVLCFALHRQGIEGTAQAARTILLQSEADSRPPGQRIPRVLFLPCRVEENGPHEGWLTDARVELDGLGELSLLPDDRIPYRSHVALGENIIVGGSVPDTLTRVYECLTNRVLGEARPETASPPPWPTAQDSSRSFLNLRSFVAAAQAIANELLLAISPALANKSILALQQWVMEYAERHRALQGRVQDIAQVGHELVPRTTIRRTILDAMPQAPGAWPEALALIDNIIAKHHERWARDSRATARNRLVAVIHNQPDLVDQQLRQLDEILAAGAPHRFAAALEDLIQRVRAQSRLEYLDDLLRDELDTLIEEPDDWLDHKLRALLERRATVQRGERDARVSENILRLRRFAPELGVLPEHWTAYDLVLESAPERAVELFQHIGQRLWMADWDGTFRGRGEIVKHHGSAAREQLLALERDEGLAQFLDPIIDLVLTRLPKLAEDDIERLHALIESRHLDPAFRRAVSRLAEAPGPGPALLPLWTKWQTFAQRSDPHVVIAMLETLTSTHPLAAFYAWAGAAVVHPEVLDSPRLADIDVRFVLGLLDIRDRRRAKALARVDTLLSDQTFVDRIVGRPLGPWLVAAIAMDPVGDGQCLAMAAAQCRHELRYGQSLAIEEIRGIDLLPQWLELREQIRALPSTVARLAAERTARIQGMLADVTFYRAWHSSTHYEHEFQSYWTKQLERALDTHGAGDELLRDIERNDGQTWLDSAYRFLRQHQPKVRPADGPAKANALRHHASMMDDLADLIELRVELPNDLSLRQCVEADQLRQRVAATIAERMRESRAGDITPQHALLEGLLR
jgi:MinD-like ATPase involved in chromosome partitioning or flagellar assembly